MWARITEILIGIWLMASLYVFQHDAASMGWAGDLICGVAVVIFGVLSLSGKFERAHLLTLLAAAWLVIVGYLAGHPSPPAAQNQIITGLLLAMFAIIPTRIGEIPKPWQEFYSAKGRSKQ